MKTSISFKSENRRLSPLPLLLVRQDGFFAVETRKSQLCWLHPRRSMTKSTTERRLVINEHFLINRRSICVFDVTRFRISGCTDVADAMTKLQTPNAAPRKSMALWRELSVDSITDHYTVMELLSLQTSSKSTNVENWARLIIVNLRSNANRF